MEVLTIVLSALIGILSPVGFVADRLAEDAIRDQFDSVESLAVRIDNAPNYQFLQGRADRVRIAGRGLYPIEGVRIDALEVETDPIDFDLNGLQSGEAALERPLQAAIKLVLTEEDINQVLRSPLVMENLQGLNLDFSGGFSEGYTLTNPQLEFLENNRLRFQITLQRSAFAQNQITAESEFAIVSGRQLQLIDPTVQLDGEPLPPQLLEFLIGNISQRLDLGNLESSGVTARILKLEVEGDRLTLVSFVRVEPGSALLAQ
ncbi:MAG: DUF2993 domain-containing protein [Elainellaceae cyanobacterium]